MATITPSLLKLIIADQQEEQILPAQYLKRTTEKNLLALAANKEIIVLTGVRRCGKSVLLHFIRKHYDANGYYFNFEDERLATFTSDDFQLLHEVLIELFGDQKTFYFDEIQNIPNWEMFVRRLYNTGYKIFITGSNATLFSDELGTRLTGRYISQAVYPYSFLEYVQQVAPDLLSAKAHSTKMLGKLKQSFNHYCQYGGIPDYATLHQSEYLHSLYESILFRDIIARYKITNVAAIKQLVFFLASNCSKETTFNALRKLIGIGSTTTISDYCGYLENSYLCFFLNRYKTSIKSQNQSPKKIYFIDHALAKIIGFRFSEDQGRMLENIVYIELKRRGHTVFYHRENKECDFLIQSGTTITTAIQVCHDLSHAETRQREINGLIEALEIHDLNIGFILTDREESDEWITKNNRTFQIRILPVWRWLLF